MTINSGAGDDVIRSYGDNITINAGAGEDDVFTSGYSFEGESEKTARNYKIYGGAGDDILGNYCASYVTIDGGTGNDNISNDSGDFAVLIGGDGDDTIGAGGEDAGTLSAGDTIMAAQEMIL